MKTPNEDVEVLRRTIRDAMDRLLTGNSLRSDGKLTIKSLATEAAVKRWVLTHQHTDLQEEFRERCDQQGATPESQIHLNEEITLMKRQIEKYKSRVSDLGEENHRLCRVVQVLTMENIQLQEQLSKQPDKVRYLR